MSAKEFYNKAESLFCAAEFEGAFEAYLKAYALVDLREISNFGLTVINGLEVLTEVLTFQRLSSFIVAKVSETLEEDILWYLNALQLMAEKLKDKDRSSLAISGFNTVAYVSDAALKLIEYHHQGDNINIPEHSTGCFVCLMAKEVLVYKARSCLSSSSLYRKDKERKEALFIALLGYQIAAKVGSFDLKMKALVNLASVYFYKGNFRHSISLSSIACDILNDLINCIENKKHLSSMKMLWFHSLRNLSRSYNSIGNFSKAIKYAEDCFVPSVDPQELCQSFEFLGNLYIGTDAKLLNNACRLFKSLVKICRKLGDYSTLASSYEKLCTLHLALGNQNLAVVFAEQIIPLAKKSKSVLVESRAYGALGVVFEKDGQYHKALDLFKRQLTVASGHCLPEVCCISYLNLGSVYFKLRSFNNSKFFLENGLKRASSKLHPIMLISAELLLVEVLEVLGDFIAAHEHLRHLIFLMEEGIFEKCNSSINPHTSSKLKKVYKKLIVILVKLGRVEDALEISEHINSRYFTHMLDYNSGHYPVLGSLDTNRMDFLPAGSFVLFFSLCKTNLFLWVLNRIKGCMKFCKTLLSTSSTKLQISAALSSLQTSNKGGDCCFGSNNRLLYDKNTTRKAKICNASLQLMKQLDLNDINKEPRYTTLRRLFNLLLAPIEHILQDTKPGTKLFIIARGALAKIPFHLLTDQDNRHLFHKFQIIYLPCLKALKVQQLAKPTEGSLYGLVAGNPVVTEADSISLRAENAHVPSEIMSYEMRMISSILSLESVEGPDATKDVVLKEMEYADVIHMVTVGNIDTGRLLLSPNVHRKNPQAEEESFVVNSDNIASLNLRAKLVFLSCCQDCIHGLIERNSSELKLVSSTLAAGADAVVLCRWAMPYDCHQMAIHLFYRFLQKGLTVSESVQMVLIHMEQEYKHLHAGFWGGLVHFGQDVSIDIQLLKTSSLIRQYKNSIGEEEPITVRNKINITVHEDSTRKAMGLQQQLAKILHHAQCKNLLLFIQDLISVTITQQEKFYTAAKEQDQRLKMKCATKFIQIHCLRDFLILVGFQFQVDIEKRDESYLLLPLWNFDSILSDVHQFISAAHAITMKSFDTQFALCRLLQKANVETLHNLKELVKVAVDSETVIISESDARIKKALCSQEQKDFLYSLGFYASGDSVLFRKRQVNLELAAAAKKLCEVLLDLHRIDAEEKEKSKTLMLQDKSKMNTLVAWSNRKLTSSELSRKTQVLTRIKGIDEEYTNLKNDGKRWHNMNLDALMNPEETGVFVGPRQERPRGFTVASDGNVKRKVVSGATPSMDRKPIVEDPVVTLADINGVRKHVYTIYKERNKRLLRRRKQEKDLSFYGNK